MPGRERIFIIVVTLTLFTNSLIAEGIGPIPCPNDDWEFKHSLWLKDRFAEKMETDRIRVRNIQKFIRGCPIPALKQIFGPTKELDDSYALPTFSHAIAVHSGINLDPDPKFFLPLEDKGGILIMPYRKDGRIDSVSLYLKVDEDFLPLREGVNLSRRFSWENSKLIEIEKLLEKINSYNKQVEVTPPGS